MLSKNQIVSNFHPDILSEDRYRLLIDSTTDYAIFLLDPNGHIATWNAGASRIKQYKPDEIIGEHFSRFYTDEANARDYPAFELKQARLEGKFEDEGWRVRKDGSLFWASVLITAIYNSENALIGLSKITRDLSERKKAEDELKQAYEDLKKSEERYRLLIGGVADYAIFMLNPMGQVVSWNEGAKRIKGYEADEIIGKSFSSFYSRNDVESGFPDYELKMARAEGRFEDEGWRFRKDGTAFWANVVITAIFNDKKELIGFSKITRDLTERKQLELKLNHINAELKESEEKTRLLIDSVRDYAIIMLNPEGYIVNWNVGAELINGYTAKEILGKHFSIFYSREAIENGFPLYELQRAREVGRFEDEGWRFRKDRTSFWANVIISPIYNAAGTLIGFGKITRDLTERRRNEELMQKNKELLRINNDLDNFVYTASHDLKSPIINLESLLIALQEDLGTEKEKHEQILEMMEGSVHTLKKVISDLGDIAKLQQHTEKAESVNIPSLIDEIKTTLSNQIAASNTTINSQKLEVSTINYSPKNLRSILFNLITNAIKYAHPQHSPHIMISTKKVGVETELAVTDNGLGIPQNQVDKIFWMFKRAHDHVEGTGVGLYLVRKILDNSGDRIAVESAEGRGSVFKVYFKQPA